MAERRVQSDMNGSVWKILVKEGDVVEEDDAVAILESMKMEIPIVAPVSGKVTKILVVEGQSVSDESVIMHIEH